MIFAISIYDIQYTNDPGFDGTYPSSYLNHQVHVEAVVTAVDKNNSRFFVSEREGGAWKSICIVDSKQRVEIGQLLSIEGRVSEIHGMTCIKSTKIKILSQMSMIPQPYHITLFELNNNEAYESVLVKVCNLTVNKSNLPEFPFSINSNSNTSFVGNTFKFTKSTSQELKKSNQVKEINTLVGIVAFTNNRFSVNPRTEDDIIYQTLGTQSSSWGKIKSLYR
jgi:predicted extracellular nuclease